MDLVKYQQKLWKIRGELQYKGIHKPIHEMTKQGIIKKDPKYSNYLLGRVRNDKFLKQLEKFNNNID